MKTFLFDSPNRLNDAGILPRFHISVILKLLSIGLLAAACCGPVAAQTTNVYYSFTVGAGFTLSDVYLIDTEPAEAFASLTALSPNGQTFGPGSQITGMINGTTYGTNYLTLIAVFTNATATNVAISLPSALAATYIPNRSWSDFNNASNFPVGLLPDEPTTLSDLQSQSIYSVQGVIFPFNYMSDSVPVLQPPGSPGVIVAFDGAQNAGTFSVSLTPPVAALPALSIGFGGPNSVVVSWPDTGSYTLLQNAGLTGSSWTTNTSPVATANGTNSVTITPPTGNLFFRLSGP